MVEQTSWKDIMVKVGHKTEFTLGSVATDIHGANPLELKEAIEGDAVEVRLKNVSEFRLFPNPDAVDFSEWDRDVLLRTWPPLYSWLPDTGASSGSLAAGLAQGQEQADSSAARLGLRTTCLGCLTQMATARQLVNWALGRFGPDHPVHLGLNLDNSDFTWVGVMCGFQPKTVAHLARALSWAEAQVARAFMASSSTNLGPAELESHSMHAGTCLLLGQEVLETVKVSLLGFSAAADIALADIAWYPPPVWGGLGMVQSGKKKIVFVGDNPLPAWYTVGLLRSGEAAADVEVCGIGQAADDLPRFYEQARWVGPMVRAKKVVRTGIFNVIVGSDGCLDFDLLDEARRSGAALIWSGVTGMHGLADRTGEDGSAIIADLLGGCGGAWLRDPEKAARVALGVAAGGMKRDSHLMDEKTAKGLASRCRDDCDLCTFACPNAVQISRGIKAMKKGEGLNALAELEKKCCLFGKCDRACPETIPISDMMLAAFGCKANDDKFLFRPGRGGGQRAEVGASDSTASPGNSPGWFGLIGCGRASPDEVQWIAEELASRNGVVVLAGCTVGDVAHAYFPDEKKWYIQKYASLISPRSAANLGGCSACQFLPTITLKNSRSMAGVTHYANYVETAATVFDRMACVTVVWGPLPDRMYAIVSGLVRSGISVIVGPVSGLDWPRLMPGNKWDWDRYYAFDTLGQRKRLIEPSPRHMIMAAETPEEAVNLAMCHNVRPAQGFRMSFLEGYLDTHRQYFRELPDDWQRLVRSPSDLPIYSRIQLLGELTARHGWKMEGMTVKQVPMPDGRLVDPRQYAREYGAGGAPVTRVPRLCIKPMRERKA
ncbi:MAG: hypothetical protein HYX90_04775 [Chloroflexi bacterium]|nr:hypothetical protein [Chloroflexota bacterium]